MGSQGEFVFEAGDAPSEAVAHPLADLIGEISRIWSLPLGRNVRVDLAGESMDELRGRLELASAPDLPLDPRQPLMLRIGKVTFSSRQITGWAEIPE
jgi:hypothetical protein